MTTLSSWLSVGATNPPRWRYRRKPVPLGAAVCLVMGLMGWRCDRHSASAPTSEATSTIPTGVIPGAQTNKPPAAPWFTDITSAAGIDFVHETGAAGGLHMPEIMCGGAGFLDYDNDVDLDICLITGRFGAFGKDGSFKPHEGKSGAGAIPRNRLYRQDPGLRFVDVTDQSGLDGEGYGMGLAVGDYDNDSHVDVFVTNYGASRLYRNLGAGAGSGGTTGAGNASSTIFEDATERAGIGVRGWASSAAFVDYDRDGHLDLFVVRYLQYDPASKCSDFAGRPDYCGPKSFPGTTAVLLHNDGDGTFTDVRDASGIASKPGPGLGVVCADLNDDGWVDIYAANDGAESRLWVNQQDGTFRDDAMLAGVALNWHGLAEAGMGVIAEDLDGDLDVDLFKTHLRNETNTLYVNRGGADGFDDASASSGIGPPSLPFTGFGTVAFDVELDGDLDVFVVNGRVLRGDVLPGADVPAPWDLYAEPSHVYINNGGGRFQLGGPEFASFTEPIEISRALAAGDVDNDGDIDLLVCTAQGKARLYRNDVPRRGHWLTVRAIDPKQKRDAAGAAITVIRGDRRWIRRVDPAYSYLSSNDPRAYFGLGDADSVDAILVRWPDGAGIAERFPGGPADRFVECRRGEGQPTKPQGP